MHSETWRPRSENVCTPWADFAQPEARARRIMPRTRRLSKFPLEFVSSSRDGFSPNSAGDCNRFGRYQSRSVRFALSEPDAEFDRPGTTTRGGRGRPQHFGHIDGLCAGRAKVLSIFGISLDVFRVVGGMIIAYMGFDMLRGSHTVAQAPPDNGDADVQGSLVPLLMFAVVPGTITAVVTLAAVQRPMVCR